MKIHFPNSSNTNIGGGFTFLENIQFYFFMLSIGKDIIEIVEDERLADIIFISGATMLNGDEFNRWKDKKIVLRVDGVPKNSRNGGRGIQKLEKAAKYADLIIYQSNWAREQAMVITNKTGPVIYNGCNQDTFFPSNKVKPTGIKIEKNFLYVGYRKEEDKRFSEAKFLFQERFKKDPDCKLTIVGRISDKKDKRGKTLADYKFDFYNNEKFETIPPVDDPEKMADIMRQNDVLLFPSFADPCPNVVVEALSCGLEIEGVNEVGGTRELMNMDREFFSLERMGKAYFNELKKL